MLMKKNRDLMSETIYKYDKKSTKGVQLVINNYKRCTVFLSSFKRLLLVY